MDQNKIKTGFVLWEMLLALTCLIIVGTLFAQLYCYTHNHNHEISIKIQALLLARSWRDRLLAGEKIPSNPIKEGDYAIIVHKNLSTQLSHFYVITIHVLHTSKLDPIIKLTTGLCI